MHGKGTLYRDADHNSFILHCPDNKFRGMLKTAATKVGRWIGFLPCDDITGDKPSFVKALSHIKKIMEGSTNEDATGNFQQSVTLRNPLHIKFMHFCWGEWLVPVSLIDLDSLSSRAGCTAVGQKVRRVSKHKVYGFGWHSLHGSGTVIVDELKRNRQCSYSLSRKEERVCHLYSFRRRRHIKAPA